MKASQKRTKRAALREASQSNTPAKQLGWFAMIPVETPLKRPNAQMIFGAYSGWISSISLLSTIEVMISFISYGLFGLSGTKVFNASSIRSTGSVHSTTGAFSILFCGMNDIKRRIVAKPSSSLAARK